LRYGCKVGKFLLTIVPIRAKLKSEDVKQAGI